MSSYPSHDGDMDEVIDLSHQVILKESLSMASPQLHAVTEDVVCYLSGNVVVLFSQSTLEQRHLSLPANRTLHSVAAVTLDVDLSEAETDADAADVDEALIFVASTGLHSRADACAAQSLVHVFGFPSRSQLGCFPLPAATPIALAPSLDARHLHVLLRSPTCSTLTLAMYSLFPHSQRPSHDIPFASVQCNALVPTATPALATAPAEGVPLEPTAALLPNHFTSSAALLSLVAATPTLWVAFPGMPPPVTDLRPSASCPVAAPPHPINPTYAPVALTLPSGAPLTGVTAAVWTAHDTFVLADTTGALYTACTTNLALPSATLTYALPHSTLAATIAAQPLPRPPLAAVPPSALSHSLFASHELALLTPLLTPPLPSLAVSLALPSVDHPADKQRHQQLAPAYSPQDAETLATILAKCPDALPPGPAQPHPSLLTEALVPCADTAAARELVAMATASATGSAGTSVVSAVEGTPAAGSGDAASTSATAATPTYSLFSSAFTLDKHTSTLRTHAPSDAPIADGTASTTPAAPRARLLSLAVCSRHLLVGAEHNTILWFSLPSLTHVYTLALPAAPLTAALALSPAYPPPHAHTQPPALPPLPLAALPSTRAVISITFAPSFSSFLAVDASGLLTRVTVTGQPRLIVDAQRVTQQAFAYWARLVGADGAALGVEGGGKEVEGQGAAAVKVLQSLGVTLPRYPLYQPTEDEDEDDDDDEDVLLARAAAKLDGNSADGDDLVSDAEADRAARAARCERFLEEALLAHARTVLVYSLFDVAVLGVCPLAADALTAVYRRVQPQALVAPLLRTTTLSAFTRPVPALTSHAHTPLEAHRARVAACEAAVSNGSLLATCSPCGAVQLWAFSPRVLLAAYAPAHKTTALAAAESVLLLGNVFGGVTALDVSSPLEPRLAWSVRVAATPVSRLALDEATENVLVTAAEEVVALCVRTGALLARWGLHAALGHTHTHMGARGPRNPALTMGTLAVLPPVPVSAATPAAEVPALQPAHLEQDTPADSSLRWLAPRADTPSYAALRSSPLFDAVARAQPHMTLARMVQTATHKPLPRARTLPPRWVAPRMAAGASDPAWLHALVRSGALTGLPDVHALLRACRRGPGTGPAPECVLSAAWLPSMVDGAVSHRIVLATSHARILTLALPARGLTAVVRSTAPTAPVANVLPFAAVVVAPVPVWCAAMLPSITPTSPDAPCAASFLLAALADTSLALYEVLADGKLVLVAQTQPLTIPVSSIVFAPHSEPFAPLALATLLLADGSVHLYSLVPAATALGSEAVPALGDPDAHAQSLLRTHTDGMVPIVPTTQAQREARIADLTREQSAMAAAVFAGKMAGVAEEEEAGVRSQTLSLVPATASASPTLSLPCLGGCSPNERPLRTVSLQSCGTFAAHAPSLYRGQHSLSFTADMRFLCSAAPDGAVLCWDLARVLAALLTRTRALRGEDALQRMANVSTRAHNTARGGASASFWEEREERERQAAVVRMPHCVEAGPTHAVDAGVIVVEGDDDAFSSSSAGPVTPLSAAASGAGSLSMPTLTPLAHSRPSSAAAVTADARAAVMEQVHRSLARVREGVRSVHQRRVALRAEREALERDRKEREKRTEHAEHAKPSDSDAALDFDLRTLCVDHALVAAVEGECQRHVADRKLTMRRRGLGARVIAQRLRRAWVDSSENKSVACASSREDGPHVSNFVLCGHTEETRRRQRQATLLREVQCTEQRWYREAREKAESAAAGATNPTSSTAVIMSREKDEDELPSDQFVLLRCPGTTPDPLKVCELNGLSTFELPACVGVEQVEDEKSKDAKEGKDGKDGKRDGEGKARDKTKEKAKAKDKAKPESRDTGDDMGEVGRLFTAAENTSAPEPVLSLLDDDRGPDEPPTIDMVKIAEALAPQEEQQRAMATGDDSAPSEDQARRAQVSAAMQSLPSISGNNADYTSAPPHLLLDPLRCWTPVQKRMQVFMMAAVARDIKRGFNAVVERLREFKTAIVEAVAQRHKAIAELCADVDVPCTIAPLYVAENDALAASLASDAHAGAGTRSLTLQHARFEVALEDMMGGVLRTHDHKIKRRQPVEPPVWYTGQDASELSEQQQEEWQAWQAAQAAFEEELQQARDEATAEVAELQGEVNTLCAALDAAVSGVARARVHVSKALMQYTLLSTALTADAAVHQSAHKQMQELRAAAGKYSSFTQQWHVAATLLQRAAQVCVHSAQELLQGDAEADRRARRELASMGAHVEACVRLFRARPKPPAYTRAGMYVFPQLTAATRDVADEAIPLLLRDAQPALTQAVLSACPGLLPSTLVSPSTGTGPATTAGAPLKESKESKREARKLAATATAEARGSLTQLYPYPPRTLRGPGSCVVGAAVLAANEDCAWEHPPPPEPLSADASDSAREAWAAAAAMREAQIGREARAQQLLDWALDLCAALGQVQSAMSASRMRGSLLGQAKARAEAQQRWAGLDALVVCVCASARVELSEQALLRSDQRVVVPAARVRTLNDSIRSRSDHFHGLLRAAGMWRREARRLWLESRYVTLSAQDTADITAELQLLRLTKALQATIVAGGNVDEQGRAEEQLNKQMQLVREHTGERLLSLKDSLDAVKRDCRHMQSENTALLRAIAVLQANLAQAQNIQNHKQVSRSHNAAALGAAAVAAPRDPLAAVMALRRLASVCTAQERELAALRNEVAQWRSRTFPTFTAALPPPLSIPQQHTHTQALPPLRSGASRGASRGMQGTGLLAATGVGLGSRPPTSAYDGGMRKLESRQTVSRGGSGRGDNTPLVLPAIKRK